MNAILRTTLVLIFSMTAIVCQGQEILKKASPIAKDLIDTLFIDNNIDNWSVRAFGNFKDNSFALHSGDQTIRYVPNNRFGVGLGYANSKIHLDFSINIKGQEEQQTDRFNFSADMTLGRSFFGFRIARYQGFEVRSERHPDTFRNDIESFGIDLFYTMLSNPGQVSLSSVLSGSQKQIKGAGSFVGGLFLYYHQLKADSSIVLPESRQDFNDNAQFERVNSFALGFSGGYAYNFVFAKNFFLSIAAYPGLGLAFKDVELDTSSYRPDDLLVFLFGARAGLGWNGPKWYIELSNKYNYNSSNYNFGNRGSMSANNIKLAFGWKLKAK